MTSRRERTISAEITDKLKEAFAEKEEWLAVLGEAVYQYQKKTVRKMILKDHKRPDGRAITQIRPLAAEVDIIPRVHGSAMFTRGQTQICNDLLLWHLCQRHRELTDWTRLRQARDICITTTSRPIL
ncbi:MAG: hypothetical protein ACLURP_02815 [Ruminococcus sp.]